MKKKKKYTPVIFRGKEAQCLQITVKWFRKYIFREREKGREAQRNRGRDTQRKCGLRNTGVIGILRGQHFCKFEIISKSKVKKKQEIMWVLSLNQLNLNRARERKPEYIILSVGFNSYMTLKM